MSLVTLRFGRNWSVSPLPIVLRFEVVPTLDLAWGDIGLVNEISYQVTSHDAEYHIGNDTFSVGVDIYTNYSWTRTGTEFGFYSITRPVTDLPMMLDTFTGPITGKQISIDWQIGQLQSQHTDVGWIAELPSEQLDQVWPWTSNKLKREQVTSVNYKIAGVVQWDFQEWYGAGVKQLDREYNILWEPGKKGWVCSSQHRPAKGSVTLRFSASAHSNPATFVLRFTPGEVVCYYDDGGGLIDANPDLPNFDFKVPIEPQIKRAYLMQPTLIVTRVSDGTPIAVTSVTLTNQRDQFTSSVSIDFGSRGDSLLAMNQLLLVEINGYEFYALPEQASHTQSFNQLQHSASGRSRTAQVASPWRLPISYSNSTDRSFAGVMGDILAGTGWSVLLVGFTDFNIPAGVFTTTGKGPIESVNEMAGMIGCMVVEDEADSLLRIVPRWPVTPWNMATEVPDIAVHEAVIISYSASDEINQLCDSAWVRGEQQGVSRHVRKTGTAGNIPTADISNALILSDTPARLAGTDAIARTGIKQRVSLTLPLMNDLPPLVKGMLIGVSYFGEIYKATCDSTSLSATVNGDGSIDVTQTVVIIRHME